MCMRGSTQKVQLLFYPEIERTTRRNNRRAGKRKQLAKERNQWEGTSTSSTTPKIEEVIAEPKVVRGSCQNNPRRNAHFARPAQNARHSEMKTGLIQILYAKSFTRLNHEDPYTHLTKFYEIVGTIGASEAEEEQVCKRLCPHSLIGKAKEWYLDQPTQTMKNWNVLEEKFLDRFFPHNRFMEA